MQNKLDLTIVASNIHFFIIYADRAHRIGQASAVNVYFLHVRNSVDEIIWAAIQNKLENVGQALDGQDRGMEVTAARTMPERGQRAMDSFVTQQLPLQPAVPRLDPPVSNSPGKQVQPARAFFPRPADGNGGDQENSVAVVARDGGVTGGLKRAREFD